MRVLATVSDSMSVMAQVDRDMFIVQDKRRVLPLPARLFLTFLENHPVPAISPSA